MPTIVLSRRFKEAYAKLPNNIRVKVDKVILYLAQNPRHPSLRTKPIQGAPGIYEARVDLNHRLTYQRLAGDVLQLRVVGQHDETLDNP